MAQCDFECKYLSDSNYCLTDSVACDWDSCPGWSNCEQCINAGTCDLKD